MVQAIDTGINYFDNAESCANGSAEIVMGKALWQLGWSQIRYVVLTSSFRGLGKGLDREEHAESK